MCLIFLTTIWFTFQPESTRTHKGKEGPGSDHMDVFHYLSGKYGTPVVQLKRLAVQGAFRTRQREEERGRGEVSFCWPVEANILAPTPQHIRSKVPQCQPMNQPLQGTYQIICLIPVSFQYMSI